MPPRGRLDGDLQVRRPPGSRAEVHAFVTARSAAIVAWIPDAGPSTVERPSVALPGLRAAGPPRWWDADGHPRVGPPGAALTAPLGSVELDGLELRGGDVAVVEIALRGG